jgi:hypothetical protein
MEFLGKDTGRGGRTPSLFHNLSFCESGFLRTPVVDVTLPTVWIDEPDPDAPFDGFVFHEIELLHDFYQQNGGPRLLEPACT